MDNETQARRPIEFAGVRRAVKILFAMVMAHGAFALATFGSLPERIPVHFNASGEADGFASAGFASWSSLWFISVGLGALFAWTSLRIDRFPQRYLSIPRRDEIFGLPAAARSRVMAVVSFHILVLTGLIMAFMFGLHICIALTIHGAIDRLPVIFILVGLALLMLYVIPMTVRLLSSVNREIDRHVDCKDG
jgi:uncharacterized membrane protein